MLRKPLLALFATAQFSGMLAGAVNAGGVREINPERARNVAANVLEGIRAAALVCGADAIEYTSHGYAPERARMAVSHVFLAKNAGDRSYHISGNAQDFRLLGGRCDEVGKVAALVQQGLFVVCERKHLHADNRVGLVHGKRTLDCQPSLVAAVVNRSVQAGTALAQGAGAVVDRVGAVAHKASDMVTGSTNLAQVPVVVKKKQVGKPNPLPWQNRLMDALGL